MPEKPLPRPEPERIRRIGKYEILAGLNSGGMAELYLAVTTGPGGFRKFAAVKKILPHVQKSDEFVRMFLDEARITAMLTHPGIAQVYELGDDKGELFLAMEYVLGQDLARIVKACRKLGRRPPPGFACMVVRDTCLALHYAHNFVEPSGHPSPVIHRDVSPKNVMATYEGGAKLIDFGIALSRARLEVTAAGTVKGTANYMAPEQVQGRPLDGRCDLYSAGVVLHELLSGQRLFQGRSDPEVLEQIMKRQVPAPRELNPQVPPGLSDVVMRSISRDPDARFASGKEMARAIEAVAAGMLFDPEEAAHFMRDMFRDKLAQTRALLDLSTPGGDSGSLRVAAGRLREELTSGASDPRKPSFSEARTAEVEPLVDPEEPQTAKVRASGAGDASGDPVTPLATVLTVDADPAVSLLVQMSLRKAGYRVVTEASDKDALAALDRERPDLVILEVELPGTTGFALCRELRERTPDRYVPILFLSAACTLEERMEGISAGGDDFIRKPFDVVELTARVKAHLERVQVIQGATARRNSPPPGRAPSKTQSRAAPTGRRKVKS